MSSPTRLPRDEHRLRIAFRRQPSQSLSPRLGHKIGDSVARLGVDTAPVRLLSGVIGRTFVLEMRVEVFEFALDR